MDGTMEIKRGLVLTYLLWIQQKIQPGLFGYPAGTYRSI